MADAPWPGLECAVCGREEALFQEIAAATNAIVAIDREGKLRNEIPTMRSASWVRDLTRIEVSRHDASA